jgi:hypothetical protein
MAVDEKLEAAKEQFFKSTRRNQPGGRCYVVEALRSRVKPTN